MSILSTTQKTPQYTLRTRIKSWIKRVFCYILSLNCCKSATILGAEETKSLILNSRKSVIRLGDGEFNILEGQSIHYQQYSDALRNSLNCIIDQYIDAPNLQNYILCMPGEFFRCNGLKLFPMRVFIAVWSSPRYLFKKLYDRKIVYGEAFLFAKENEDIYKQIWLDGQIENIIFVHNKEVYAQNFENQYKINTKFIPVPSQNAFEHKDQTLQEILNQAATLENPLVLISAGPCSKYLVYKLAVQNIWAIDTGHCWDNPLHVRSEDYKIRKNASANRK